MASRPERYDDGDSALRRGGYLGREALLAEGPLGSRVGVRQVSPNDAPYRLDKLRMSEILEEQGPPDPRCFALRILREPPPQGRPFELPRTTKTYDGSTKPEDWIESYLRAVSIAGGNRRWVVRYRRWIRRRGKEIYPGSGRVKRVTPYSCLRSDFWLARTQAGEPAVADEQLQGIPYQATLVSP